MKSFTKTLALLVVGIFALTCFVGCATMDGEVLNPITGEEASAQVIQQSYTAKVRELQTEYDEQDQNIQAALARQAAIEAEVEGWGKDVEAALTLSEEEIASRSGLAGAILDFGTPFIDSAVPGAGGFLNTVFPWLFAGTLGAVPAGFAMNRRGLRTGATQVASSVQTARGLSPDFDQQFNRDAGEVMRTMLSAASPIVSDAVRRVNS